MTRKGLPLAVQVFVGLGLASLAYQLVKLMLWWQVSIELAEAIWQLRGFGAETAGHMLRVLGFLCGWGLIYFVARKRSRVARLIYLVATALVIVGVAGSFLISNVDIWGNKWGILASLFQVGAAWCLLVPSFRAWLRAPAARDLPTIFS
jgi:hypothetical protein